MILNHGINSVNNDSNVTGGILYKGYFSSNALKKCIDVNTVAFNKDTRFIPYSDRNYNVIHNPVQFNRASKWDCFIEFWCSFSRTNYCLTGSMLSDWWLGFGINIDYSSARQNYYINLRGGVTAQSYWDATDSPWQHAFDNPLKREQVNSVRLMHLPNSDSFKWWVNEDFIGEFTEKYPYYGTVDIGIGGIYNNSNNFLYYPTSTISDDYITGRTYLKIDDAWIPRTNLNNA